MANTCCPARGKQRATVSSVLLLFLFPVLSSSINSSLCSATSSAQSSSYVAADGDATQSQESKVFVSNPIYKWHEDHSSQCQNLLLPEVMPLRYISFTFPRTVVGVSCIPTVKEIMREPDFTSSQVQQVRTPPHIYPPNMSCPRCQTGPWPASHPDYACWTVWSPQLICWDELVHLLEALGLRNFNRLYEAWASSRGRIAASTITRLLFVAALAVLCSFLRSWIIDNDTKSNPEEMNAFLKRQRRAIKRFVRAVDSLFRKIMSGDQKKKLVFSARRVNRMRDVEQSFRRVLRRLVRRRIWTLRELPPSRIRTASSQQVGNSQQEQAETAQPEEIQRWSLRWLQLNAMHIMLLPVNNTASKVHPCVHEQREDEDKLFKFWRKIYHKRIRKYRQRGWNRWKNTSHTARDVHASLIQGAMQAPEKLYKADACHNVREDRATRPPLPTTAQHELEHFQTCMRDIFHAFVKDASEWRYWQRNEQLNFLDVVMNQLERWRKLQLAFEGGILESTFKLTIMTNSIVKRFQDISIFLTEEEMKGSRVIRQATSRGKGTATAVVEAHSSSWTHLTEAALDARFVRQMKFLRTQFEEQKKALNSASSHTRQVEHSVEQVCQDHLRRLTANLQRSFDRQVERHLTQNIQQQPPPIPSVRIKKDLEEMKDTQKKLLERSHALAAAAQENSRQHFQDQQQQLDRMATKLHMILDRHVERDRLQGQKLQHVLDACLEKHQKHVAITLGKTTSQGNTATATLLQQQNELRRMCEAHKDQGERISHMVEDLIRQQRPQQLTSADERDICLTLERRLVKVLREELQTAKEEMVEKLKQIEQQSNATRCCSKEEYRAEIQRVIDTVNDLLQQQRQEQRSLHETLLIQRRDTLELLKHFTHLGVSPVPQQAPSNLPGTATERFNNQTMVHLEECPCGDTSTALLQTGKNAGSGLRRPSSLNSAFSRKMQRADEITPASTVTVNKQGQQQLHQAVKEKIREDEVFLWPFLEGQSLPLAAEETTPCGAMHTHRESHHQQQDSLQQAPLCWTQRGAGAQEQSEKFGQLLERWTRSINNAEATKRTVAKLCAAANKTGNLTVSIPCHVAHVRQGSNVDGGPEHGSVEGKSCTTQSGHLCGNEIHSVGKTAQLFCTGQPNSSDSRSVADYLSPVHALQIGSYQTGRKSVFPSLNGAPADRSSTREDLPEGHCISRTTGRDSTHSEAGCTAQQHHQESVLNRQLLLQQRLVAQRRQPEVTQQYEEAANSELQNLILDWAEDWM